MRRLAISSLILVGLGATSVSAALVEQVSPPRRDGKPVEVSIGFYALDFARVTVREESFDVTGYLVLRWRDERISPPSADERPRKVDARTIWTPRVLFENALDAPRFHNEPTIEIDATGRVSSWVIVSGKFSAPMILRRFPFDWQELVVRVAAVDDESIVRFREIPEMTRVDEDAFVTDWTIGAASVKVDEHPYIPGEERYSRFSYMVRVDRRPTFYVWRVLVPLSLLALVAWAAFWFEPVGLQPQISTCMAAMIALVAFNFAIDFSLPKVAYLTLIDRHALIGFGFVTSSVIVVTLVHNAVTSGRLPLARKIQKVARWAYLPAYLVALTINFVLSSA